MDEGQWFDLGDGARIRLRSRDSKEVRNAIRRATRPHQAAIRADRFPMEKMEAIMTDVMAGTIIVDWEGITEGGKPVAFSVDTARRFVTEFPEFRRIVDAFASDLAAFNQEQRQEGVEALKKSSAGK